jgi:hypothetical protein
MEAARQTFNRWRRRSLFVRLGSESQGRDQPSASLGAADLARKAGARETSRRTGVWLDADSICTDGTGKSGPFLYLLLRASLIFLLYYDCTNKFPGYGHPCHQASFLTWWLAREEWAWIPKCSAATTRACARRCWSVRFGSVPYLRGDGGLARGWQGGAVGRCRACARRPKVTEVLP